MPEEKTSYLEVLPDALEWMEKHIMGDAVMKAKLLAQEMFAAEAAKHGLEPFTALTNNVAGLAVMDAFVQYIQAAQAEIERLEDKL